MRVLITQDDPSQAQHLAHFLAAEGYEVASAPDGRQALAMAQRDKPNLVISDVLTPGMTGYELCAHIKNDQQLADVPVILLTTLSDPQDVIRGLECRADNFVLKPYDSEQLIRRIQFVLVNSAMRRSRGSSSMTMATTSTSASGSTYAWTIPLPNGPSRSTVGGTMSQPIASDTSHAATSRWASVPSGKSSSGRSPTVGL